MPNSLTIIKEGSFHYCSNLENITIPESVTTIEKNAFNGCSKLLNITIPRNVNSLGSTCFTTITTAIFNQPAGMEITLPTAGSSTGMFYHKTARNLTVYTDNETIKNYDYATDNVTVTLYHLDGTLWE